MKNTILNGGLTFLDGMKQQTFHTLVRALKVASLTVVAGTLALTGNASAIGSDTVITLNNGATDLTTAASYTIVTNTAGAITLAPGMTPSLSTDILFFNNGLVPGGATLDLYSVPYLSPTPFLPTVNPGSLTLTVNSNLTTDSINDANRALAGNSIIITNTSAAADTLTIGGRNGNNTNATPVATGTTPVGTGDTSGDLIYVATGANLAFTNTVGAGTLSLALALAGNIDNSGTLAIGTPVTIAASQTITFTGTGATTVSGSIANTTGAVVVNDAGGSVTFSGANTYMSDTTISAGILNIQSDGALGTAAAFSSTPLITVSSGAALQIQGGITTLGTGTLTLNGTGVGGNGALENVSGNNTYTGLIFITSDATIGSDSGTLTLPGGIASGANTLTLTGAGNGIVSSNIGNGAGGLIKTGTGTWALSAVNSYTGPTTVNAGTLTLDFANAAAATNLINPGALVMAGGTLNLTGKANTTNSQTFSVTSIAFGSSTFTINNDPTANPDSLVLTPAFSRSAGTTLTFFQPTNGTPSATNGYATAIFTASTILSIANSAFATVGTNDWAAKDPTNTFVVGLSTIAGGYTNTTATTAAGNADFTNAVTTTALAANTTNTSVRMDNTSADILNLNGNTLKTGGILIGSDVGAVTETIDDVAGGGALESFGSGDDLVIIQNSTGILTISAVIANNTSASTLTLAGAGQVNLLANNTYSGGTYVDGSLIEIGTGVVGPATITPFGSNTVNVNGVTTVTTDGTNTTGAYTVNNAFILNAPLTVNVPAATGLILGGVISGAGTLVVNNGTTGTLTLTGANGYTGGTIIDSGTVTGIGFTPLGNPDGTLAVNGSAGGTVLNLTTTGTTTIGSLSGSTANGAATINTAAHLFDVIQTTAATYAGTIAGVGTLEVSGTAALSLTGANSYTGGTSIDAGAVLAAGSFTALGTGGVINGGTLESTATSLGTGVAQTINVGTPIVSSAYLQGPTSTLLLQVVSNQGVLPQTQAAAGLGGSYDTLAATGTASFTAAPTDVILLNFQNAAPALPGQRFQVVSVPGALNPALVTSTSATTPTAVTTTGNINPNIIPITSYNDSFNGAFANNNIIVTLFQPFNTFTGQGLTPNQNSVANSLDTIANNLFNPATGLVTANGVIYTPLTGAAKDFFDNILEGVSLAGGAGNVGHALDEFAPQRYEVLRNVAYDNYAFDIQSLDQEFARERMGVGGIDTAGFTFNNSQLGPELSQVRSRLLAWSPAPEPGLLSDSSQAVLGGVKMADKKDMKEMAPEPMENLWNVFIDGGADLGDKDGNEDLSHSSYTTGRVRLGADYRVCTDLRVGALFGYNHTDADLDNEGSKAHVDSYTPGIFLTYADKDGFYANGLFTYTDNEYKTDRDIIIPGVNRTAGGSFSGNQFGGDLDGGYDFHRGAWTFGPSAGLTYVNLGMGSFTESGAGAADLGVNSQSTDSLRSRLGGTVSYRTEIGSVVLTPHASAYWQHEFLDDSTNITSSFVGLPGGSFAVQTTKGDSDNALVGAGLNAELNQTVTLFVDYGAEAGGSTFFGQSATGGVKIGF